MTDEHEKTAEFLFGQEIIGQEQIVSIKAYKTLGVFSLHHELLLLLYIGILMISGAIGILIYQNIDTIGHAILIALVLAAAVSCFYYSLKKAPKYSNLETFFENPVFDYGVLFATLLSGTFFGYLQYQYSPFGNNFALASVLTSAVGFASAYRFDNRSALSIAITALAAAVGIALTPRSVLDLDVFEQQPIVIWGILLGILLVVWGEYSFRTNLKRHFSGFFFGFAQHLIGIACIVAMVQENWGFYLPILAASSYYFFRKSHETESTVFFVFSILYGFIGGNIALIRLLLLAESENLALFCAYLAPFFYLGSIVLFVQSVRKFNRKHQL